MNSYSFRVPSVLLLATLMASPGVAQKATSLKECLDYASTNNRSLKISGYELNVAQSKISEQLGAYLPQVNASASLDDNLKLTKQLMPAAMFGGTPGTYKAVSFGTKYNASAGLQVTQSIFDPQFFVSLKAVKTNRMLSEQNMKKMHESVTYNISVGYYQALIIQKQLNVLRATLDASEESLKSAELRRKNGMAKQIDVDKLRVSYNNTQSMLKQSELSYNQSLNNLKNQMGMALDSTIVLPDAIPDFTFDRMATDAITDSTIGRRSDYQILKTNMALTELDKRKSLAAYLPTLSAYGNYSYSGSNQQFKFMSSEQTWFNSSAIGLKLSIPIFSGMQRYQRLNQAKLNIAKSQENMKLTEQTIRVQISNYEIQYRNALDNIQNESENFELAKRVFESTQLECRQGVSTTLDLVQAESALREAQNSYFNKLLSLYIAKIDYEQSKGNLENFITSQIK